MLIYARLKDMGVETFFFKNISLAILFLFSSYVHLAVLILHNCSWSLDFPARLRKPDSLGCLFS